MTLKQCPSQSVSAGKALDLLADLFKVPNYNNAPCNPDQVSST